MAKLDKVESDICNKDELAGKSVAAKIIQVIFPVPLSQLYAPIERLS